MMPAYETLPTTLDYEAPIPWRSFGRAVARHLPLACWGVALGLCVGMVLEIFGSLRRTSVSTDPQIDALNWAWGAIALRSAIALARRERTWWSLAYVVLFFVLPLVADRVAKWWRSF